LEVISTWAGMPKSVPQPLRPNFAVRGLHFEGYDEPLRSEGRGREFESRRVRHLFNHLDNPAAARVPVVSRLRSRTGAVISRAESWAPGAPTSARVSRSSAISGLVVGGGRGLSLARSPLAYPRIAYRELPERSNGAVSKCAWRRAGLSRSIPGSEVLCGFQPCCRRVLPPDPALC
jgi:hypothetical protein